MGLLKKIGKPFGKLIKAVVPGTGRHAARRAVKAAEKATTEAEANRVKLEAKTAKERARAQKLAIRGIRSKRAASHFSKKLGEAHTSYGSPTIG